MEKSMVVPQKIKNRTSIWSNNFTSEYISKENANTNLISAHYVYCITYGSQDMELRQISIGGQMNKEDIRCIYTYMCVCICIYLKYITEC